MRRHSDLHQSAAISAVLLVLLFALPLAVVVPFQTELFSDDPIAVESEREPFQPGDLDGEMVLKVLAGDTVEEMTLGEYLVGVVRAEMPASFEPEALKAQAVAARTYTLYKMQTGGNHGDTADICTDSTCCQAYISEENARNNWGENADAYEEKIETAVRETDGETILYGGVPILAVFHSCSAGQTRSSGQVWVSDLPYLQAVSSPEPADSIPNYYSRVEFTAEEFREKVLASYPEADLSGDISGWLQNAVTDTAGSVESVDVGGVSMKGSTLRSVLGLRSACFEWEAADGKLVFFVTGYGHGVGMSQWGANYLAEHDPHPLLYRRHRGALYYCRHRVTLYKKAGNVVKYNLPGELLRKGGHDETKARGTAAVPAAGVPAVAGPVGGGGDGVFHRSQQKRADAVGRHHALLVRRLSVCAQHYLHRRGPGSGRVLLPQYCPADRVAVCGQDGIQLPGI